MSRVIPPHTVPPSQADLETIAHAAFAEIPEELRVYAADVVIRVDDFPDEDTEQEMGLETPFDLLGLYRGCPCRCKAFPNSGRATTSTRSICIAAPFWITGAKPARI